MGETIRVVAAREESASKALTGARVEAVLVELDSDRLRERLQHVTAIVQSLLVPSDDQPNSFGLKQMTVGIEINAEGGVALVGTLKAGAKAAITLTFERK